ncbi:hypothetical protein B0T25DRAFT_601877, partial [Lasiosphaeria hispida]
HILDPSGDVILTLKNPSAPFAVYQTHFQLQPYRCPRRMRSQRQSTAPCPSVSRLVMTLILASPVLKAALTGGWKESTANEASNVREVGTDEWDTKAMTIAMGIIHHRWSQVPRIVDLELLAKIAVIVDYYQIHETVQLMGDIWINRLRLQNPPPKVYGRELVLWMCISSVYKHRVVFKHVTEAASGTA